MTEIWAVRNAADAYFFLFLLYYSHLSWSDFSIFFFLLGLYYLMSARICLNET